MDSRKYFLIPSEEQGPGVYAAFLVVSDLDEVSPSDTRREFVVTVTEVNSEPYFPVAWKSWPLWVKPCHFLQ